MWLGHWKLVSGYRLMVLPETSLSVCACVSPFLSLPPSPTLMPPGHVSNAIHRDVTSLLFSLLAVVLVIFCSPE